MKNGRRLRRESEGVREYSRVAFDAVAAPEMAGIIYFARLCRLGSETDYEEAIREPGFRPLTARFTHTHTWGMWESAREREAV